MTQEEIRYIVEATEAPPAASEASTPGGCGGRLSLNRFLPLGNRRRTNTAAVQTGGIILEVISIRKASAVIFPSVSA